MKRITKVHIVLPFLFLGMHGTAVSFSTREEVPKKVITIKRKAKVGDFWVVDVPTPNVENGTNKLRGIVLHHTASRSAGYAIATLCNPEKRVSAHVVIDRDGTRYVLAEPTKITWHAGYSVLNGKDWCNNFTLGIEFQGNTQQRPLTEEQINSAIDYIIPIMKKYGIHKECIVTHEYVRKEWNKKHPEKQVVEKADITPTEYVRFMNSLTERLEELKLLPISAR